MSVTRLFTPTGRPTRTARERQFFRDLARLAQPLEQALHDLERAVDTDDVERGVVAARRALSVGYLLGEAAREVERA